MVFKTWGVDFVDKQTGESNPIELILGATSLHFGGRRHHLHVMNKIGLQGFRQLVDIEKNRFKMNQGLPPFYTLVQGCHLRLRGIGTILGVDKCNAAEFWRPEAEQLLIKQGLLE